MIWIFKWWCYLCLFITLDVLIYGTLRISNKSIPWEERKTGLMTTYIWMLIIYSILPLNFELFISLFNYQGWYMLLYIPIDFALGFIVTTLFESLLGYVLLKTINTCPWGIYTKEQGGIWFLGGFSKWNWSLLYGALAIVFHEFTILFNSFLVR